MNIKMAIYKTCTAHLSEKRKKVGFTQREKCITHCIVPKMCGVHKNQVPYTSSCVVR